MRTIFHTLAAGAVIPLMLGTAFAQDHSAAGHGAAAMDLPEACRTAKAPEMPGMDGMHSAMETMGDHQKAFMQGMMATEGPMMQGMMAEDPDIAFLCAMIPHHQGAINMAGVVLEHGDNEAAKTLARAIIAAQEKEIAEMRELIAQEAAK